MADPTEGDRVAYIALSLYGNGAMSISGNIGDLKLALQMLDNARAALNSQWAAKRSPSILIPGRDVEVSPSLPLIPHGDIPEELRPKLPAEGVKS
jgi:hypothetical protein